MSEGESLPIDAVLPAIDRELAQHPRLVVQAEPGAGKSTRIPPRLLAAPWLADRRVLVLEPRRVAARNLATFVAEVAGEPLGRRVGFQVRGERQAGPATRLLIVTEGILTRLLQDDPELADVGAIVFDEFHERHLQTDLGLALALDVQASLRPDLRIVLMSATIDAGGVAAWFDAPAVTCEGRRHPVTVNHRSGGADRRLDAGAVADAVREACAATGGDVLVFLPGRAEIETVRGRLGDLDVDLRPLYGALPLAEQRAALAPGDRRRVVLATNIAESSLTVPGVTAVVDAGLERAPRFDPQSGLTRLVTRRITRDSAEQRAGRAGRLGPGVCYRLWSPEERLVPRREPEIRSADLSGVALELAAWGCTPDALAWLDPPPEGAWHQARELLALLGALDREGTLTPLGRRLLRWGTEPRLAAILEGAGADRQLAALAVALLEGRDPLPGAGDDLRERVRAWRDERLPRPLHGAIDRARRRWLQRGRGNEVPGRGAPIDPEHVGAVISRGLPDRLARRRADSRTRYLMANGRGVGLAPESALAGADWLVVCDARLDEGDSRVRLAAPVDGTFVEAAFADRIRDDRRVRWDSRVDAVVAERVRALGAIVLDASPWPDAPPEALAAGLLDGIRQRGLDCLPWSRAAIALRQRVRCVHGCDPSLAPDWSDERLLADLDTWLAPYLAGLTRLAGLRSLDLARILRDRLGYALAAALDRLAPVDWPIPSGRRAVVDYADPARPVLAAKLQELFGARETPRIVDGRLPLTIHLLSPAGRPLQITQDLPHFWANGYPEVRKEMRGRYPKHPWPEDPLTAEATARTKRRGG